MTGLARLWYSVTEILPVVKQEGYHAMPDDTLTVADVAELLAVSGPTIRRWAGEFAPHLSSLATPPAGAQRFFTHDDVRLLLYCKRRLGLGLPVAAVLQELPTATPPTWSEVIRETGTISDDSTTTGVMIATEQVLGAFVASQARLADHLSALVELGELRARVAELERRIEGLEHLSHGHPGIVPTRKT